MCDLDETDMETLSLLAENARRPFSEIADEVGLSGPAVSDRIGRLEESGIIRHSTIDVDRAQLRAGVPVLIQMKLPRIPRRRRRPTAVRSLRTRSSDRQVRESL
jgi:DNA-binding Lrp family transcriptional regulator